MYEAVGLFFPFVRYAAFTLVIRSLLAECSFILQKCVAIFEGHICRQIISSCSGFVSTCSILPVESNGGPRLWACKRHFSFDRIYVGGPVGPGFDLIWRVVP